MDAVSVFWLLMLIGILLLTFVYIMITSWNVTDEKRTRYKEEVTDDYD